MLVNDRDCLIAIKTQYREMNVPYAEETPRKAVSLLAEEVSIEGDGFYRVIRKSSGVSGCVVTPLIGTPPLLLALCTAPWSFAEFLLEILSSPCNSVPW
jgi:hypothetical protein